MEWLINTHQPLIYPSTLCLFYFIFFNFILDIISHRTPPETNQLMKYNLNTPNGPLLKK